MELATFCYILPLENVKFIFVLRIKLLQYKEKYGSNQPILPALSSNYAGTTTETNTMLRSEISQLWRFCREDIFGHSLEIFLGQLMDMRKIFESGVSFQNLEKLEIGGMKGKYLTERVRQVSHRNNNFFHWCCIFNFQSISDRILYRMMLVLKFKEKQKNCKFARNSY